MESRKDPLDKSCRHGIKNKLYSKITLKIHLSSLLYFK